MCVCKKAFFVFGENIASLAICAHLRSYLHICFLEDSQVYIFRNILHCPFDVITFMAHDDNLHIGTKV